MQKIFSLFFLFVLLAGAGCVGNSDTGSKQTETKGNYRKVSITGTVTTKHSGVLDPKTFGLVACLATGTYEINLWFSPDGGQAIKQDNKLSIAKVDCPSFGNAKPCVSTIDDSAHEFKTFEVQATLSPNSVKYSDSSADQLEFQTVPLSNPPTINVSVQCAGSTPSVISDYGSFYNQILAPFAVSTWSLTTRVDEELLAPFSRNDIVTVGNQLADVTYTVKEEWTSEL
ncbi:MAG: hypothetical protein V1664_00645 [Candidatus Uhrbacteria bacterium]